MRPLLVEEKMISFPQRYGNFIVAIGTPNSGKSTVPPLLNIPDYKLIGPDVWTELLARKKGIDLKDHNNTSTLHARHSPLSRNRLNDFLDNPRSDLPNLLWETTGQTPSKFFTVVEQARAAGYVVTVVLVWVPLEVALARNAARHRVVDPDVVKAAYGMVMKHRDEFLQAADYGWVLDNSTPHECSGSVARDLAHFRSGRFIRRF